MGRPSDVARLDVEGRHLGSIHANAHPSELLTRLLSHRIRGEGVFARLLDP